MSVRVAPFKRKGRVVPGRVEVDIRIEAPAGGKIRDRHVLTMSKSAADRWAQKHLQLVIEAGRCPDELHQEVKETPSLAAFWPRYKTGYVVADGLKPTTVQSKKKTWRLYLEPLLGAKRLDEISTEAVQLLKGELLEKRELAPKTVNNALGDLSSILRKAVEWEVLAKMPRIDLLDVDEAEIPEYYEPEVLEQLLEAARRAGRTEELVVLLGAEAGMRAGEIVALEWGDVDFARSVVRIRRGETIPGEVTSTKSNRERRVPLSARLQAALEAYRHLRGPRLFYQLDGTTHATLWWLRDQLERAQKLAGLAKVTGGLHVLRHTFCSILAMRGVPVRAIQRLAGHASLAVTLRYMHLAPDDRQLHEAIEALGPGRDVGRRPAASGEK